MVRGQTDRLLGALLPVRLLISVTVLSSLDRVVTFTPPRLRSGSLRIRTELLLHVRHPAVYGATLRDFIFLFLPAGEQQTVDWDQFCEHFAQFDLRWMFERRVEICIWIIGPCWRESSCLWEHLDERDLKTFRQYLWLKHWRFFSTCSSVAVTDRHVLSADHNRTSPPEVRVHLITLYRLYCPH